MSTSNITIKVRDLRLRTFIGFNPDEREKKQDVIINVTVRYPMNSDILQDKIDAVLNYKILTKQIIALVENNAFLLLERLTADVLALCREHEQVTHATVEIEKPHALRFADSVSATLSWDAAH